MNDKQKLALKELADVMEKHGINIQSYCREMWIAVGEDLLIEIYGEDVEAKYIEAEISLYPDAE